MYICRKLYLKIFYMKITILKNSKGKEVVNRVELERVAEAIMGSAVAEEVQSLRRIYHLMKPERQPDGQVISRSHYGIGLPRICFAADYMNRNKKRQMIGYNALVVLELNGLESYEQAVSMRDMAKRMPETLMAFLGASGKSVKIVCRGEMFDGKELPKEEEEIRLFHLNLYNTARMAYQNQFLMNIEYLEPEDLSPELARHSEQCAGTLLRAARREPRDGVAHAHRYSLSGGGYPIGPRTGHDAEPLRAGKGRDAGKECLCRRLCRHPGGGLYGEA